MDWTQVEGNWKQMKGRVKERWGKLTDDDLTVIAGRSLSMLAIISKTCWLPWPTTGTRA